MRRERAYTLALRAHDAERALFELPRVSGTLLSQSEFRAAPGGARLAWLEGQSDGTNHSTLHVMADGSGELTVADVRLFRFSPDGTQLAAVVTTSPQQSELVVVDLASDERRSLGALRFPFQLEWSAGAVMVRSMVRGAAVNDQLERIALDGERLHPLNEHCIDELAVAARASRAIYLTSCGSDSVSTTPHLVLANFATGSRRRIDLPGRESIAFREQVGLPPHAYVTHRRVSLAQVVLARGVSQAEVALQAGLYDQSQLHRTSNAFSA